jgi:hypothetical protein
MKQSLSFLTYLVFSLLGMTFLSSCGDIQQELFLNADGSGKIEASFELGEAMSMMKSFDDMGVPDDTLSDDNVPEDTALIGTPEAPKTPIQLITDRVTDPNYPLEFDTLMALATILPDSVMAKENRMDLVKKLSIHMKSPANSSDLTMGIVIDFDNHEQLQEIINHLDTLDGTQSVMPGGASGGISKSTFMNYKANFKEGWITVDSIDYSSYSSEMGMASDSTTGSEDMGMMQMMFGNSKVRTIVHVPGEVISCSNKDAIITKDEKVIIEYDFLDVIKKGKVEGYTINFKPKK